MATTVKEATPAHDTAGVNRRLGPLGAVGMEARSDPAVAETVHDQMTRLGRGGTSRFQPRLLGMVGAVMVQCLCLLSVDLVAVLLRRRSLPCSAGRRLRIALVRMGPVYAKVGEVLAS